MNRSEPFLRTRESLLADIVRLKEEAGDADLTPADAAEYTDYWHAKKRLRKVRRELHIISCADCLAAEALLEAHCKEDPPDAVPASARPHPPAPPSSQEETP